VLEELSKEIQKAALENIANEIPRLKYHNSRFTDMQLVGMRLLQLHLLQGIFSFALCDTVMENLQ
jgi:hypothetical protein